MALQGAGKAPAVPKTVEGTTVGALTEAEGSIGGTNDGDLPDLDAAVTAILEAESAVDITDSEFAAFDLEWDGLTTPSAANEALIADALREIAGTVNVLITDVAALRAGVRENADKVNDLIDHLNDGRA